MKKLLLSFFILLYLQLVPAMAQYEPIPDINFANWLTQEYPSCMSGTNLYISCPDILADTILNIQFTSISDLSGIEYFTNLKYLNCQGNQLTNITALPPSLRELNCSFNQLTSLPTLPSTLKWLSVWHNQFSSLPSLPDSLELLDLYMNQFTNLPPLPQYLDWLDCSSNQLTSLPSIPFSLHHFRCDSNQISSLPILPQYAALNFLSCTNNLLTSLPTLPEGLTSLYCSNNLFTTLPAIPSQMTYFYCNNNALTYIPNLPSYLLMLDCSNNQINSLPSVPNTMSKFLINNNNISCLNNLPYVFASTEADISNNLLSCVPNSTTYNLGLPICLDNDPVNNPNQCPTAAVISGFVFKDINNNCQYNNLDIEAQNVPVKIFDNQNNFLAYSYTIDGAYSFALLQADTFIVKIDDVNNTFSMGCGQPNNQSVIVDSLNQSLVNINFPVVCDTVYDLEVHTLNSTGWVFPGQMHHLNINIANNINWNNLSCNSPYYSGIITFNITGPITYASAANNALIPIVNGNTFTYNINNFNWIAHDSFGLQLLTDTTAQAGDQICVHVEINPTPLDADTTNNSYDFCYNVVNSYDPNMKEVYPVNVLPGYDDWFTYTIHFQNTGNAPAFNIRLRDTLDANLDINSFEVRGYSHPATISLNGNILTVRFNNILLPDSTTDYEGSMGYFQYRIKPLANMPNGTQIENTAYIYFDYNAPVVTNTTQNNFDFTVQTNSLPLQASHMWLFPNPSTGIFTFNDSKNINTVEVFNMMGELVLSQGNAKIINLQAYPKGIYVARINGVQVSRLVKE